MLPTLLHFFKNKPWLAFLLCIFPAFIYAWVFDAIALNANYVAFDDILILGIIPGFGDASWPMRWQRMTELFPEHRLVFSRSVILLLYTIFGKVNLVWAMVIANVCWAGCALVFYRAFRRMGFSLWYFVPVMWFWFNIQSFENIFWGVSSLCNFGVILFVITAIYCTVYHPGNITGSLLLAVLATFTYGNGLMAFPLIGLICLVTGRVRHFFITLGVAVLIAVIYFSDFTPITQNMDFSDPVQVREAFFGFFGFIGSIGTISAYGYLPFWSGFAVAVGMLMVVLLLFLFWAHWKVLWDSLWLKRPFTKSEALFVLSIAAFICITVLALIYKRIATDSFDGLFKGRYRMYSTLALVSLYFAFLVRFPVSISKRLLSVMIAGAIGLNLVILHGNFAQAIDNRREAIVQEFNARYNADWLGVSMFSMDQAHFEEIRALYGSEDPLAEGWNPRTVSDHIPCDSLYLPDTVMARGENIVVRFGHDFFKAEKDYSDGAYVLLKSKTHVYASSPNQFAVPVKTMLRRWMYFDRGAFADFHEATVEPGLYDIFLLVRKKGKNRIYCTGKRWSERD